MGSGGADRTGGRVVTPVYARRDGGGGVRLVRLKRCFQSGNGDCGIIDQLHSIDSEREEHEMLCS
jgi:hypothetical protein